MSESVVSILSRLVQKDSHNPGGDEPGLAQLLAEELARHQPDELACVPVPHGERRGAYVFARWGRPRVVVNAHLDTVPPNAGWTGDPFAARVSDGRLVALGAADTKGAIACALAAASSAGRPRDVALLFSGDEEHSGTCVRAFLAGPHCAGLSRAIVCEPTSLRAGTRHRGILALAAHVKGEGGHSSRADRLPAPIADLARLAVTFDAWGKTHRESGPPGFPGMCVNVARLDGGVAFNVVPEQATLEVSLRPPPGADARGIREELLALAARILPQARVDVVLDNPPFQTRSPASFEDVLGETVRTPVDLAFWTEAAVLAQAGIDCVVWGPGDIAQAHAPDEWVEIAQLEAAQRTLERTFRGEG